MLRSMFSGVSGLRSHQTMMDVIGNNIANVNTVGYKASSAMFQDLLSQVLRGAGAPVGAANGVGGTNPAQVGLGVRVAGIATSFAQGASQLTGRATDVSIQGDGFFVVRQGGQQLFTRAGSFDFDALGRLTTSDGSVLQGWAADADGVVNTNGVVGDLTMPLGQNLAPAATGEVVVGGNLDASAAAGTAVTTSINVYDAQGTDYKVSLTYTKTATPNQWTLAGTATGPDGTTAAVDFGGAASVTLDFDPADGSLITPTPIAMTMPGGQFAAPIDLDLGAAGDPRAVTQFSGDSGIQALSQDGSALGSLQSFTIGEDGMVTGVFSNGRTRPIGQLALSAFANPGGLEKVGSSLWRPSVNSGLPAIGTPGTNGRGMLAGSTLEMSNVDLAREFTNLIVAQRGFQANSRVITSSDELLQDLVNLKR